MRGVVPMGVTASQGPGFPFPESLMNRYEGGLVPQGVSAEIIAEKWDLSRQQLDEFGLRSHELAAKATDEGKFTNEITPITRNVHPHQGSERPNASIMGRARFGRGVDGGPSRIHSGRGRWGPRPAAGPWPSG